MSDRDAMIRAEQQREADVAERRKALLKELDAPDIQAVIAHRRAEEQLRRIQGELQVISESNSARHGQYRRDLEKAMPDELRAALQAARAELSARRRPETNNPAALRQLADLRQWLDDVTVLLRDETVSSAKLFEEAARGRGLLSLEVARA